MRSAGTISVVALVAALGASRPALAGDPQLEQARAHFQAGQKAYGAGRYAEALREFEAGYALSPRPEFLLNFAQTDRKLGRTDEAIDQCQRFLAAMPDSPLAPEARRLLQTLREERAFGPPFPESPARPTTGSAAGSAAGSPASSTGESPARPAAGLSAHPPAESSSRSPVASAERAGRTAPRRKWVWITVGVAAAVVAVGVGVGLGVGLSTPRDVYPSAPLVVTFGR